MLARISRVSTAQFGVFAAITAACFALSSCSSPPTAPPLETQALTTVLERGVSTEADVRAALGEPNGFGAALMPTAEGRRNVWFYERITVNLLGGGAEDARVRQEVLMVFFDGGVFDGYLWFSDEE